MSDFGLRALSAEHPAAQVRGVTRWSWLDHSGFQLRDTLPTGQVPTGWVWGWGDGVWVRWRSDPYAPPVGAELRREPAGSSYVDARVVLVTEPASFGDGDASMTVPSVVREERFLMPAPGSPDADDIRRRGLTLVRVLAPVQLTFYSLES